MRTTLGRVLQRPEEHPWNHALYATPDATFDDTLPVLIWDVDDIAEDDSDLPAEALALGYDYVLDLQTLQSIVANARQQRPEATAEDLLGALVFYYDNDAFIVFPARDAESSDRDRP